MSETFLSALTAAGGNSRAARSARARLQWRDRYGRWIEMGRGVKFKVRGADGAPRSVIGSFVGAVDTDTGQVYVQGDPNGLPDGFYDVKSNNAQEFVANLSEAQLADKGIQLGRDADGRAVGERAAEVIPNINEMEAKDAPAGWVAQPGLYGGKKVIQTDDGDFRVHYSGNDKTVLLEDHRANPGQAEPQRSLAEAFKKVSDVDVKREESGDSSYTGLADGNDDKLASRSRDEKVEQIKANERTLANERSPLGAKQTAMDANNQLKAELEADGQGYDPEGADSDEALAARKAAPEGAPGATDAAPAAPSGTSGIDTSTFDVAPEGFLVPTGKITNDITPEGLANFITAEKESLSKGGARLVVDTDAKTAEVHNSADTLDNAKAQAGGLGQSRVLDLAGGKEVQIAEGAVDPNAPDVNPNLEGDTSPEAPNAENRDPNAVEPVGTNPGADAPASPGVDGEAQRPAEQPAADPDYAPAPRRAAQRAEARAGTESDSPAAAPDGPSADEVDPWATGGTPTAAPGSVEDLKNRRALVQAALDRSGDPKDIIALNEQADALDNRIAALDGNGQVDIPGRVREDGGLTISTDMATEPTDGYMVAVQGHNLEIPEDEFFNGDTGARALVKWIDDNQEALGKPGAHIGLWHDTENGEVVFDVSERFDSREEAERAGRQRNQQAIWDVANGEEISTGGTGDREEAPASDSADVEPDVSRGEVGLGEERSGDSPEPADGGDSGEDRAGIGEADSELEARLVEISNQIRALETERANAAEDQVDALETRLNALEAEREAVSANVPEVEGPDVAAVLEDAWNATDPFPDDWASKRERAALRVLRQAEKDGDIQKGLARLSDEEKNALSDEVARAVGIPRQSQNESAAEAPTEQNAGMAAWDDSRIDEWRGYLDADNAPDGVAGHAWAVQKMAGTDGGPEVLSGDDFDSAEGEPLWRGVSTPDQKTSFIDGDDFVGMGGNGSGVYLSTEKGHAARYGNFDDARIIEAKLKPDAVIVDAAELEARRQADFEKNYADGNLLAAQLASGDLNTYASAVGVDGYRIELEGVPSVVIANKGALIVRGESAPETSQAVSETPDSSGTDASIPSADNLVTQYSDLPAGELSVGDIIRHPGTGNPVRITNIDSEFDDGENDTRFDISYDSRNNEEAAQNDAAENPIEMWQSWRDAETLTERAPDATPAPEPAQIDDPANLNAQASRDPEDRLSSAEAAVERAEADYTNVLLDENYDEAAFDAAEDARFQARENLRRVQEEMGPSTRDRDNPERFQEGTVPEDAPQPDSWEPVEPEAPPVAAQSIAAPSNYTDIAEAANVREVQMAESGLPEGIRGALPEGDDPFNVRPNHGTRIEAIRAKSQGKDLSPEERDALDQLLRMENLSDNDLNRIDERLNNTPNRANTTTVARPVEDQPDYLSTADLEIVNAERDDPSFVFDEDLTWRRINEEFPDRVELDNGDLVLDETTNKGKRYQVVARRTNANRFLIYVMETDQQGFRRAKRIGNTEWHSYEALEKRITAGRKLINSKSPAGSLARRKDQPTENLGTQGFPQDDFLGDIANPDAPVPSTGDEKFDVLIAAVADNLRNGNGDFANIEAVLQDIDPGANAVKTIMNAVIGRANDNYRPQVSPLQMYSGETAQVGDHFDWTDWHQELDWWLPNGQLNPDRRENPNYGLVGRGRVVGFVGENTDGKGHTYGDHVWVQMLQPDGTWGNWVKRSAQTLRKTDEGSPLGNSFFSKREEWDADPENIARRFRVPVAEPTEPVVTKERPRREALASRSLRVTARGNLSGYSNVPVPTAQSEIAGMISRNEINSSMRPASESMPGMMISRMDDEGNMFVDSIIRVENLGDGGYRIHAARPTGQGRADVDSFVVPGDADIILWSTPGMPAPKESEPTNARRGELVEFEQGNGIVRGVVSFDDGKGNLIVMTETEPVDILESNIKAVEAPEVSAKQRNDLLESLEQYEIPESVQRMIQSGVLSPSLSADRFNALSRMMRAFRPNFPLSRLIDKILEMVGASPKQRDDARDYMNR